MNIYRITPLGETDNWDNYEDAVVVAANEQEARLVHPSGCNDIEVVDGTWRMPRYHPFKNSWVETPGLVGVELIGVADSKFTEPTVICASFHAG